jgi:NADH dehydrogenase [ubiquinone] 1 alpha subcomplex assembly factor 7
VDFSAFAATARKAGATVHGPVGQGRFLKALGIETRAAKLRQNGSETQGMEIEAALQRLTAPESMGTLFKVLALTPPQASQPAGFA